MNPLTEVKRRIYKAVPELLELKKGCNTSRGEVVAVFESEGRYSYAVGSFSTRWDGERGQADCPRYPRGDFEILGSPIQLSDVILAISKGYDGIEISLLHSLIGYYNLALPFDQQSPELYLWLLEIIPE